MEKIEKTPQTEIPEAMVRFVRKHHVLTLATQSPEGIWCANCFYAFDPKCGELLFTSSPDTRHGREMAENPQVAASIVLETRIVGCVQGLQLTGTVRAADERGRRLYLKRFPYAAVADLHLWALGIEEAKLTDNTLGFGKKLLWKRSQPVL
ncbi:MAG: hypothetical protein E7137_01300 [Rikenellaceae bacterium]|nr:hypothetical protein [Rikenellaceae bacterium]